MFKFSTALRSSQLTAPRKRLLESPGHCCG